MILLYLENAHQENEFSYVETTAMRRETAVEFNFRIVIAYFFFFDFVRHLLKFFLTRFETCVIRTPNSHREPASPTRTVTQGTHDENKGYVFLFDKILIQLSQTAEK